MSKKPIKKGDNKKSWNKRTRKSKKYPRNSKDQYKYFLIICEGKNTEPEYFKSFPVKSAEIKSFGTGRSKSSLVDYTIKILRKENLVSNEIWIVFDMDIQPQNIDQQKEDLNIAIAKAAKENLNVVFSNDAFEVWFLLHYSYFDNQGTRHEYYDKLSQLWNCNYEKEAKKAAFCTKIYHILENDNRANQEKAIKWAEKLHNKQINETYFDKNPYTGVYRLVKELNNCF